METFNPKLVAALNTVKYEAVPILDYLCALNRKLRGDAAESERQENYFACLRSEDGRCWCGQHAVDEYGFIKLPVVEREAA